MCIYSGTSLLRSSLGLGHSDLNMEVIILVGLISYTVTEIIWDCPRVTLVVRFDCVLR